MTIEVQKAFEEAMERLEKRLGLSDTTDVIMQAMALARLEKVDTADDLYLFACLLVETNPSGFIEAVGHALKVKALLLGAAAH